MPAESVPSFTLALYSQYPSGGRPPPLSVLKPSTACGVRVFRTARIGMAMPEPDVFSIVK